MSLKALALIGTLGLSAQSTEGPDLDALEPGTVWRLTFRTVPRDLTALARAPFDHPKAAGLWAGGLLLVVAADRPLTEAWQKQVEPRVDYTIHGLWEGDRGGIAGADTLLVASLPAWYAGSLALGSGRGQVAALLGVKAATYSYVVGHLVLKTAFARERPNPTLGLAPPDAPFTDSPWRWGQFHRPYLEARPEGTAFPSFHATLYASVAAVFAEVYGTPWIPYGVALALFGADIRGHRHWVSDLVAGAALGVGIGRTVVREFKGAVTTPRGTVAWSLQPWTDLRHQAGVAVRVAW